MIAVFDMLILTLEIGSKMRRTHRPDKNNKMNQNDTNSWISFTGASSELRQLQTNFKNQQVGN